MTDTCDLLEIDPVKRGDTLQINGIYKFDGTATSIDDYTITSMVRDSRDKLTATLTVTKEVDTGYFTLTGGEIDWRPGTYYCDIQFTDVGGFIRSTETFIIPVVEDITYV